MKRATVSWQDRRAEILQRACSFISEQQQNGMRIGRAIRIAAKKFANADLGNGHRLTLSAKTMQRLWYRWSAVQNPSVFRLQYNGEQRSKLDPLLLRLVFEYCLQTGASLTEAVEAVIPPGARLEIRDLYRAVPKRALDAFSESQRQLSKRRAKIERDFLSSDGRFRKTFVKQRLAFFRELLKEDARLVKRLLRGRDCLQRKFFQSDARAVRQREQLQRNFLNKNLASL